MYQAIEILESFIWEKLSPSNKFFGDQECILELSDQIKKSLVSTVFELKKDRLIEFYIQNYHRRLIDLSNSLYTCQINNSPEISLILKEIDNLLSFLIDNFSKYINNQQLIPEKLKQESIKYFIEKKSIIEKCYKSSNEDLLLIALKPLNVFISSSQASTYHQLSYIHRIFEQLLQHVKEGSSEYLKHQLLFLNFNSFSFLHYLSSEISNQLKESINFPDKLEKLSWYLKWVKQIQVSEQPYHLGRRSIKELLSDWLIEEIAFLEKCIQLNRIPNQVSNSSEEQSFKLITDLSVPQLAYLIRIFMDSGLFKNKNHKAITRFFAQHIQTKNGVTISPLSLLNKLYEQDGDVEKVVKGLVINMLNQISKLH